MIVGVPREIKTLESRVAITPEGVAEFVKAGHSVLIESGAGIGSSISDTDYRNAGCEIVTDIDSLWQRSEMIMKVKEPLPEEYSRMRKGQILFTYLHLAASQECTDWLS